MLKHNGRIAEWMTSAVLLALAFTLAMPGDTFNISISFQTFKRFGLDEASLATMAALVASGRMVALYVNGMWRRSPMLRLFGAVFGAMVFSVLATVFGYPYFSGQTDAASTGFSTYLVLALADVIAAYRSAHDARLARA